MSNIPKKGDKLYVPGSMSISHGSTDTAGGLATVKAVEKDTYVTFDELPGHSYGLQYILEGQKKWSETYKDQTAHPDPDIDTPWIQAGDHVNGQLYTGPDVW